LVSLNRPEKKQVPFTPTKKSGLACAVSTSADLDPQRVLSIAGKTVEPQKNS